jgi:mRNA interferase RelE/StbE
VRYTITVTDLAVRALRRLTRRVRARVWERIRSLADDPRPRGSKALRGALKGSHGLRVGEYRIIYRIEEDRLIVVVVDVGAWGEVYGAAGRRRQTLPDG